MKLLKESARLVSGIVLGVSVVGVSMAQGSSVAASGAAKQTLVNLTTVMPKGAFTENVNKAMALDGSGNFRVDAPVAVAERKVITAAETTNRLKSEYFYQPSGVVAASKAAGVRYYEGGGGEKARLADGVSGFGGGNF